MTRTKIILKKRRRNTVEVKRRTVIEKKRTVIRKKKIVIKKEVEEVVMMKKVVVKVGMKVTKGKARVTTRKVGTRNPGVTELVTKVIYEVLAYLYSLHSTIF